MKKLFYISLIVAVALTVAIWQKQQSKRPVPAPHQTLDKEEVKSPGDTSHLSDILESSVTSKAAVVAINTQSYAQAVKIVMESENAKSLDLYGVVIDQHGEPVVGAKIRGAIGYNNGPVSSSGEFRYTESDSEGRFNFLGIHGAGIGIWPTKDGYYYNPKLPSTTRPDDYLPALDNPLVFKMWKLRGKEPLVSSSMEFKIPSDGTTTAFDLTAQKQDANGNVRVVMARSPTQVKRSGQKFDWDLKIEMVQGGLIANDDPYPYWAPESGYVPSFQIGAVLDNAKDVVSKVA